MDISNINKDELISKGKEVTDAAYQKSLEVIERTKIRFKLQEAKTKQRRAYLELGKIAYEQIKSGDIKPDERLQSAESDIDTAKYGCLKFSGNLIPRISPEPIIMSMHPENSA